MKQIFTFFIGLFSVIALIAQSGEAPFECFEGLEMKMIQENKTSSPVKVTGTPLLKSIEPDGTGSEASPYLIASLENLLWLAENSQYWNKHYLQDGIYLLMAATKDGFSVHRVQIAK